MNNGNDSDSRMTAAERLIHALFESHERTQSELRTLTVSQVLMSEELRNFSAGSKERFERIETGLGEATDKVNVLLDLLKRHVDEPHPPT